MDSHSSNLQDDADLLAQGVKKHEATTRQAEEAARTAERTRDMAKSTLTEMKAQRTQLNRIQDQYDELEHGVDKAESLLSWLGRCCWCCNCCRAESANPRKGWGGKHYRKSGPKPDPVPVSLDDMRTAPAPVKSPSRGVTHTVGNGIDGHVGEQIRGETRKQDQYLDQVEQCLDELKVVGQVMNAEIKQQAKKAEDVRRHTEHAHSRVQEVRRHKLLREM